MISVLSKIRAGGGTVAVVNETLRIEAPPGLLSAADKTVLVENRDTLVRLLAPSGDVDPEREAVQWVENLSPAEAAVVVDQGRQGWAEIVGTTQEPVVVEIEADDAMVKRMAAAMGVPNPEYDLSAWAAAQLGQVSRSAPTLLEQNIGSDRDEEPVPCRQCGGIEAWWDATGGRHCTVCDRERLERSQQLLDDAARLRAGRPLTFKVGGKAAPTPAAWPPAHLQLPSTVEAIEQGRPATARQQTLLDDRGTQIERMTPDQKKARSRSFVPAGGW
jgi:hypothetical protein